MVYKVIDLFAGTGAFSYIFEQYENYECVFANDYCKNSKKIYNANHNIKLTYEDLNKIDIEDIPSHDILCAGFNCFIAGTKVLTNTGYKNIEEITLTDKLLTHIGRFKNICNLQSNIYSGLLFTIIIKYHNNPITCTSEHPFYIREKITKWNNINKTYEYEFNDAEWIQANNITKNHYFGMIDDHLIDKLDNYQLDDLFIENGYIWYPLENIKNSIVKNINVYNFEVEEDNSYIVENTIVHNCQPFSIAGKQKGFDDDRTNAFLHTIKIIEHHNTPIVIFENVKNLLSHDSGKSFEKIKEILSNLDYHYKYKLLNTCKITNVPQNRERVFIICFKQKELYDKFDLHFPNVKNIDIIEFLEEDIPEKYYYSNKYKMYNDAKTAIVKPITDNVLYQYRRHYFRENKSSVCPTLTANMGAGGHNVPLLLDNNRIRKLTPRECFNLQGFPDNYILPNELSDSALYKLAGNAVSLPVINLIIQKIVDIL